MSNNINFLDLIKQKDRLTEFENQRKKQQQEQQQQNLKKCSECFKPNYELNNKNICGSCNDIKDNSKNFRDKVHTFNNQQEYLEIKKRSSQDSQNSSNNQLNKQKIQVKLFNKY
ncbi:hypothetical protein PPERSA_08222 [Pseudocohnilembus persalinus]|uniref:Uncharacterized protein n=1 Tax=Pseudocohnilembus persalinus TaxID=266149 RepID=A0A0V0QFX9_PSEPJ|nr:hypothetical protein PPERSA_08222 [Pseudocohnilembus persalinus]|eukprot:KRX01121.1 hypothetical protein PPERSA_08222 [Pseudocohnilembus persalinus]